MDLIHSIRIYIEGIQTDLCILSILNDSLFIINLLTHTFEITTNGDMHLEQAVASHVLQLATKQADYNITYAISSAVKIICIFASNAPNSILIDIAFRII